jgi:hypothetical protein
MKRTCIPLCTAAVLLSAFTLSVSADGIMTLRMDAEQTAVSTGQLAENDAVIKGGVYIDNYTGINKMRLILNSDGPVTIENGDFTRVEGEEGSNGEPQLAFFKKYSLATYTQESLIDDDKNIALWHGPGANECSNGEVYHADSSFLSFDIRVPKDTPVGDYSCFISTERKDIGGGMVSPDFYAYSEDGRLTENQDILLKPVTISVYNRGDVNCDGNISVEDAQYALNHYVAVGVNGSNPTDEELETLLGTKHINAARRAADASEDGELSIDDVQNILLYATEALTGLTPDWNNYFK